MKLQRAVTGFLVSLLWCLASALPQETLRDAIRVQTTVVNVPVILTDAQGKYVPGLKAADFSLLHDGLVEPITFFAAGKEPIKVALLLDTSKSTVSVLTKIKKAAASFLKLLRPQDQAMIVTFDSEIRVVQYLTDSRKELEDGLHQVKVGSGGITRMRDAIKEMAGARFRPGQGRRAIVVLTDGQDNGSSVTRQELLSAVSETEVPVYTVFYHVDPRELARKLFGVDLPGAEKGTVGDRTWEKREEESAAYMKSISDSSAGRFYRSEIEDLNTAFAGIAEELRQQYLLGFSPQKSKFDGNAHSLKVQCSRPDLTVRARTSYRIAP